MSSAIYFLSHAHLLYLQHLSQLSALLRFFCFRNKILQLHFVAQNRRRQRSAQHVPHRALASFAPAASTCKIKQNAAALCNTNMIATHCTNTSHSNRRTPYVRARRPKFPASDNSAQSARGSTAQCYFLCLLPVLAAVACCMAANSRVSQHLFYLCPSGGTVQAAVAKDPAGVRIVLWWQLLHTAGKSEPPHNSSASTKTAAPWSSGRGSHKSSVRVVQRRNGKNKSSG